MVVLDRRTHLALEITCATLLGGVLGLAYILWRHRTGRRPVHLRRARTGLVALLLLVIAVGTVWRTDVAIRSVHACSPPGGRLASKRHGPPDSAALVGEEVATWPETGVGLLFAQSTGANICLSTAADYYVAVPADVLDTRATTLGDVTLSPEFEDRAQLTGVANHEARHRTQWAIATAIGGPFAFPVAYYVDDFFFPGPRNHFERLAGLQEGLYQSPPGDRPVLGPVQIAVLCVLGAAAAGGLVRHRTRRRHRAAG